MKKIIIGRVGESKMANNGQKMTIIEYRNSEDIDVCFEDGTVVSKKNYSNFKRGLIANPNVKRVGKKIIRTGETAVSTKGQSMKVKAYRNNKSIDVEFEDGTLVKNKTFLSFRTGKISNPHYTFSTLRTGQKTTASNGMEMKIITYRNCRDIDVEFSDGTIVKHKSFRNFLLGKIAKPKSSF